MEEQGKPVIGINYEKKCYELEKKIGENKYEFEKILKAKDEQYTGIINEKQKEIEWLKSVISGVLHIR